MEISRAIAVHGSATPDKVAIEFEGRALSYADLDRLIGATAAALRRDFGLTRGERIAYLGLNSPESLVLLFAAARLGLILVPLNWRLAVPELRFVLDQAGARRLFAEDRFRDTAEQLGAETIIATDKCSEASPSIYRMIADAPRDLSFDDALADAPLLLVYTSGTTGRPKGAVLTQSAVIANSENSRHMHAMTAGDRVLTVLPTFHVGGLNIQTVPALVTGATVLLHPRFDPGATLEAIAVHRPTLTVLVPTVMRALLSHPAWENSDLSSLRAVAAGSTDVPIELIRGFHDRGVPVIQVYGATETGPIAIYQRPEEAFETCGSIGRPGHCNEIRLVDEQDREVPDGTPGELLVKGANLASGYWRDRAASEAALADGWFRTGDIALRDAAGLYWFKDRKKNVIISGGENIYPAEVERVLSAAPGIAEVAVVGRPDPRWGAVPVAVVAGTPQAPDQVLAHIEGQLARYKHPKAVIFVDALPRNAMGKVEIEEVRAIAQTAEETRIRYKARMAARPE